MDEKAEYMSLRQELLDSYTRQIALTTFAFTATAALVGYGITARRPEIFLLPLIFLWLALMQLTNNLYLVFTISVYIRKYIESTKDFPGWESDISTLRDHLRKNKPLQPLRTYNPITSLDAVHYAKAINITAAACIGLCVLYAVYGYAVEHFIIWQESGASILAASIFAYFWISRSKKMQGPIDYINSGKLEEDLPSEWDAAKKAVRR